MTNESSHPPHRRGRHRAPTPAWKKFSTAIAAAALAFTGAGTGTAAAAAPTIEHEVAASWRSIPASADNGTKLQAILQVNTNSSDGTKLPVPNVSVTAAFPNGSLTALPQVCLTEGVDPISLISADGTTLTCNLGEQQTGTAVRIVVDLMAQGANGSAVTGEVAFDPEACRPLWDQGQTSSTCAKLPPIPIVAEPGIDVILDALPTAVQLPGTGRTWFSVYFGVSVPTGAETLSGPVSFDITLADSVGDPFAAQADLQGEGCNSTEGARAEPAVELVPMSGPGSPFPASCDIVKTGPGTFHVTMDSGDFQKAFGKTSTAAGSGATLRTDRRYVAAGAFGFSAAIDLTQVTIERATVSNVTATTTSGQSAPEVDLTNNSAETTLIPSGAFYSIFENHAPWADDYGVLPQAKLRVFTGNALSSGRPMNFAGDYVAGSCAALGDHLIYAGNLGHAVGGAASTITDMPVQKYWYTGNVSDISTLDCNSDPAGWTTTEPADLPSVRAVKVTWNPAQGTPSDAIIDTVMIGFDATIAPDAPIGSRVWHEASYLGAGTWHHVSDLITPIAGQPWPGTGPARDVAHIIGAEPSITKTASPTNVKVGDIVTYTVTSGLQVNGTPAGERTWTTTDTQPAGVTLIPGSASTEPDTVTVNPDGTSTIRWTLKGEFNTDHQITYKAVVVAEPGNLTNRIVMHANGLGWGEPGTQAGSVAEATITLVDSGSTVLTKTDRDIVMPIGGSNRWTITLTNKDTRTQDQTDTIDVLPKNGDEYGSDFHGDIVIDKVTADGDIYWTDADPSTLNRDPADPSNGAFGSIAGNTAGWSTTKPAKPAAIRVIAGALAPAQAREIHIDWTATGNLPGDKYWNLAYARATLTSLKMTAAAEPVTVVGPLVKLTKAVDERIHQIGDIVDWHLTLTNTGNGDATGATAVTVGDEWPDGKTFLGASHGGTYDPATGIVTWPSVEVPAGQSVDLTVTGTVDSDQSGLTIVNPARATVPGCADDVCVEPPGNPCTDRPDFSCAEIEIPTPLIKLVKDTARTVHLEGDQVIYTLVLSNIGAGHAIGDLAATAVDPLPAGLTFASSEGSVYDPGTRTVSWPGIELYAGDQIELQLTVTVDPGTAGSTIVNRAQATGPGCGEVVCVEPPGNPCSDDASWSCAPIQIPKLELGKTVAEQLVGVDDQVHWQVIVTNAGPTILSNVPVVDQFDATMELVSASHAGSATSATTIGWTIPTIAVGETVKLDIVTRVLPTAADPATGQVGTQHNKVTVTPTATCVDETCVPAPTVPQDNQCPDNPAWACAEVPGGKILAITSSTPIPPPTSTPMPPATPVKATPLAHTGVGEWMPQALAIVAGLIGIGGIALYATRRRRTTEEPSSPSSS